MRVLVQRVSQARVSVDGQTVGQIAHGLLLLLGFRSGDDQQALRYCAQKCAHLRVFTDDEGKMIRSLLDIGGSGLCISQFTLFGDCRKGRRPSFDAAACPAQLHTGPAAVQDGAANDEKKDPTPQLCC